MQRNKKAEFFADLFGYYWTKEDLRRINKELGAEAFDMNNWDKEAAFRFVCSNIDECRSIFIHKDFPRGR